MRVCEGKYTRALGKSPALFQVRVFWWDFTHISMYAYALADEQGNKLFIHYSIHQLHTRVLGLIQLAQNASANLSRTTRASCTTVLQLRFARPCMRIEHVEDLAVPKPRGYVTRPLADLVLCARRCTRRNQQRDDIQETALGRNMQRRVARLEMAIRPCTTKATAKHTEAE